MKTSRNFNPDSPADPENQLLWSLPHKWGFQRGCDLGVLISRILLYRVQARVPLQAATLSELTIPRAPNGATCVSSASVPERVLHADLVCASLLSRSLRLWTETQTCCDIIAHSKAPCRLFDCCRKRCKARNLQHNSDACSCRSLSRPQNLQYVSHQPAQPNNFSPNPKCRRTMAPDSLDQALKCSTSGASCDLERALRRDRGSSLPQSARRAHPFPASNRGLHMK